jgi:hypothetical protein
MEFGQVIQVILRRIKVQQPYERAVHVRVFHSRPLALENLEYTLRARS